MPVAFAIGIFYCYRNVTKVLKILFYKKYY